MYLICLIFLPTILACDMSCRMGCDTFNGIGACYNYCGCSFIYSPIPISPDVKSRVAEYQLTIFTSLHCADKFIDTCKGTTIEKVECMKNNGCKIENGEELMRVIPKEL